MAIVITTMAYKGGVGKSTITWSLAGYLASKGSKVLIIDVDHQHSLSQVILTPERTEGLPKHKTVAILFDESCDYEVLDVVHKTLDPGILIVPSNKALREYARPEPKQEGELQFILREFVAEVSQEVDYILIDTHPDCANLLTWNALLSSHYALSVVEPEPMSAQSIAGALELLGNAISNGNPSLKFLGFIINLLDLRLGLHKGYEAKMRQLYGSQILSTVIRRTGVLGECTHVRHHIFEYQPKSDAAKMLKKLGDEVVARMSAHVSQGRAA